MGVSGSVTSTGSFGRLDIGDNVSATSFTGIFQGAFIWFSTNYSKHQWCFLIVLQVLPVI